MEKREKRSNKWIWLIALLLFISVAITIFILVDRIVDFLPDDTGAIVLNPDGPDDDGGDDDGNSGENGGNENPVEPPKPGFEASDSKKIWTTNTKVDIFSVSYKNGEQEIYVQSSNGDKVIAPGTENSYIFKFKNTGNVALDYELDVEAYITPGDVKIPITLRLKRYDGTWVAGGKDKYLSATEGLQIDDASTIGAGMYVYYTLDWKWPYEGGNDELDTLLGDRATGEDLVFTLVLKTTATESLDPDAQGGIPPKTGDDSSSIFWISLGGSALLSFVLILFSKEKEDRKKKEARQ